MMKQTAKTVAAAACVAACMLLTACGGQNSSAPQETGTETTAASESAKTTQTSKVSSAASDTTSGSASSSDKKSESAASSAQQSNAAGSSGKQNASAAASDKQSASSAADKKSASAASSAKQETTRSAPTISYTEKTMWKKLYLDRLDQDDMKDRKGFQLIQVDEDGVPELYVMGQSQQTPSVLLWVKNGKLYQTELSPVGFQYIRMKNLFINVTTTDGKTKDEILRINGDKAETAASGEYSAKKGSSFYRWNGADVSAAEYTAAKEKVFSKNAARNVHKLKKLEDIRTALEQYKMYQ